MRIQIKVKLKSGKQKIVKIDDEKYLVYLKSIPENNKANIELLKLLKRYFKKKAEIIKGRKTRNKIIELI